MDRVVRDLTPAGRRSEPERPRYFSEYAARANIVLLGDPGAGKSHLFRSFAGTEGGRHVTVRSFLATPVRAQAEILFIDGLDEKRGGRGDRDTVDALVQKLFEAAPAKVRLSCRVADWLGESDLAALRPFFDQSGGEPTVLGLSKLSEDERRAVLSANGLNAVDSDAFLQEADERALSDFLDNPQNLLMLVKAVRSGQWPETRKALFELSTALMLKETDADHARKGAGIYSVDELRPVAGAVLAARLISDVEAIGFFEQEGTASVPGYRSLSFLDRERVLAALTRRVFIAGPAPESVDYAHRTTAEYVGAAWLADAVRGGLPLARVHALIGVDGHPAPELRGLHAWLAVHLPEHGGRIIDADPYGVLTYGDAASLSRSNCAHLVRALGRLSQTDPWFRSEESESSAIGALSRLDMIEEFRTVLRQADAGFSIRSIVLQALATGTPLPPLRDELGSILRDGAFPYSERKLAVAALVRLGVEGRAVVVETYQGHLGADEDGIRLRAEIIETLYDAPFGADDVARLLDDTLASEEELAGGSLWPLVERLPPGDLAVVLDRIVPADRPTESERRNRWEVASFCERALLRVWSSPVAIAPARTWAWLRARQRFSDGYAGWRDELRSALRAEPERLRAIADHVLETFVVDDERWLKLSRLRDLTLFALDVDDVLARLMAHRALAEPGSERELFFYEAAFTYAYSATPEIRENAFFALYALADERPDLVPVRALSVSTDVPANYFEHRLRRTERDEPRDPDQHRRDFERDAELIHTGAHAVWLRWLAKVYFSIFRDVDPNVSPRVRLAAFIGEANVGTALQGFEACLARPDVPSLDAVVALSVERQSYHWWFAIFAGLTERFAATGSLGAIPEDLLRAALAIDLANPVFIGRDSQRTWIQHPWKTAALEARPDLVRDAYAALARAMLGRDTENIQGLRELMTLEEFAPFRRELALEFLHNYPNATPFPLDEMLGAVLRMPAAHAEFLAIARATLAGTGLGEWQRDKWLAAAYLMGPTEFKDATEARARARPVFVFELRDRSGYQRGTEPGNTLPLPQLELIARLAGSLYPEVSMPRDGLNGDRNGWDGSRYFQALVNTISAHPSEAASQVLMRLSNDAALSSHRDFVLHALANQRARRRETEYDRPDWPRTLKALAKGPPATTADLHALLVDHLIDTRARIARTNTDPFKAFWNLDTYARPIDPRPEEACRDTLVDMLRVGLARLDIMVEPEGHMAKDKRADISAAMPARKILCELKRDYHAEVWTAAETQLERFYVHDPDAHGFGIYVVFWFGAKRPSQIPSPPGELARPSSAPEMEAVLRALLPPDRAPRIAILVIDVSGEVPDLAGSGPATLTGSSTIA